MTKADYVRSHMRDASNGHHCHWPGCDRKVSPAMWGCREHWAKLPKSIQSKIWASFRPGQERKKNPSQAYLDAARAARAWIDENYPIVRQERLL